MDNILSIDVTVQGDISELVARRVKQRRLELNLTQEGLAKRAGLSVSTYRLFERKGQISFGGLLNIAFALDCLDDFRALFAERKYLTLDDALKDAGSNRKRGNRK